MPARLHLPSGEVVELDVDAARRAAADTTIASPLARAAAILRGEGVVASGSGAPVDVDALALGDFHVLRAFLTRSGLVRESPRRAPCDNCGAMIELRPSEAFEPGPFVDGELDDAELDETLDFAERHPIAPISTPRGVARFVRLSPRTVGESARLLEPKPAVSLDRSVLAALGIRALGREVRGHAMVEALRGASDRAWADVLEVYEAAHYAPRMSAEVACAACGARNLFPVPADRELDGLAPPDPGSRPVARTEGFPSFDAFERSARRHVERVFERRGLQNIDVVVDDGVPAVDAGGEPLLGCYTPGDALLEPPVRPEIRLFYRTFEREHREDAAFDVEAEIEETLDHEAQHHVFHLEGLDPLDDEEQTEIEAERARVVGKTELTRRAARGLYDDLAGFLKVAAPIVVLLALLTLVKYCV